MPLHEHLTDGSTCSVMDLAKTHGGVRSVLKPGTVEEYFYHKLAMHKRAEPHITEVEVMREIWKSLSAHAADIMVVLWKQYHQKEFRDKLIQRQEMVDKIKNIAGSEQKERAERSRES